MGNVDEYLELLEKKNEIEGKMEKLEAEFLGEAVEKLDSRKNKMVVFKGTTGKIKVVLSQKVKLSAPKLLCDFFKGGYSSYLKEDTTITTNAEANRLLLSLYEGAYSDESMESVVEEMRLPEKKKITVKKKFKGNDFGKGVKMLQTVCGFSEEDACYWAYMLTEALMGEKIRAFLAVSGMDIKQAENLVKAAIDVNESPKFEAVFD